MQTAGGREEDIERHTIVKKGRKAVGGV